MNLGVPEILVVVVVLVAPLVGIWAIVDAAMRPTEGFEQLGQSKPVWIVLLAVTAVFCGPLGLVPSIYYLVAVRRRLATT
jgi:hypothetical protein